MRRLLAPALLALLLSSCGNPTGLDVPAIRIANRSGVDFANVMVAFPTGEQDYGAVRAGAATDYRSIPEAYRYAFIEVRTAGSVLTLLPTDYVGETLLGPAHYTYALSVTQGGSLALTLETDD